MNQQQSIYSAPPVLLTSPSLRCSVIVRIGSTGPFSPALLELEREVNVLKNRNPCPKRYKQTSKENLFLRTMKHEFNNDWCSFNLIHVSVYRVYFLLSLLLN